jgi:hypothetical protein
LRALTGILKQEPRRETISFSGLPSSGIPRGALTEISGLPGSGKSELVLRFLAENPELRVAWVEEDLTAYPCAFPQQGVDLRRVLFIESGPNAQNVTWTIQQILRAQLFGVVVVSAAFHRPDLALNLRRLQLAAEQAHAAVILLSDRPTQGSSWPIALQLQAARRSGLSLKVLKTKSPQGGA